MDRIDEIVNKAIQYTEKILDRAPSHYAAARDGLERLRDNLTLGAEDHPALGRLDNYIGELMRRFTH
jgi:hypothetical protein